MINRIALSVLLACFALTAQGAGVSFGTANATNNPPALAEILITPTNLPTVINGVIVINEPLRFKTDASGLLTVSNLYPLTYNIDQTIAGKNTKTHYQITLTNALSDPTIVAAGSIVTAPTNSSPSGTTGYSMASADARFAPKTNPHLYGTISLGASSTSDYVWTATNATGAGVWAAAQGGTTGITNTQTGVTLSGTFSGSGAGLTIPESSVTSLITDLSARPLKANDGSDFAHPRTAASNLGIQQMSPSAGNNQLIDMFTNVSQFPGQLGLAYGGAGAAALYASRSTGTGTNAWGYPIDFLGGIVNIGNPYWYDIPKGNVATSMGVYWGMGPTASRYSVAFPSGPGQPSIQPGFNIVDANPFNGAGGILIRGSFTNSAHGSLIGTNADGVKVYLPQFGFQMVQLGDAYNVDGTPQGAECQQAPCNVFILNDNSIMTYFSINDRRVGDNYLGQVPLMVLDPRGQDYRFRIPYQVANVWSPTNANWKDTLLADETTGAVTIGNGTLATSNSATGISILGNSTNVQAYIFGGDWSHSAMFNVNGSAAFNLPTSIYGNNGAYTWDTAGANRLGIVMQSGQYPKIAMASGAPFVVASSSQSDLQVGMSAATVTANLTIDGSGNVTINRGTLTGLGTGLTNATGSSYGTGSVSSVGLTMPGVIFNATVTGSPVTGSGTFTPTLATQTSNTFLAGPLSGTAATPTFRTLGSNDLFGVSGFLLTALNAANLTGSIADARLSANVPLLNAGNIFTGADQFTNSAGSGVVFEVGTNAWKAVSNGVSIAWCDTNGNLGVASSITVGNLKMDSATGSIRVNDGSAAKSGKIRHFFYDGTILLQNEATTDFDRIMFGGTGSTFPALQKSGANLRVCSADGTFNSNGLIVPGTVTATNGLILAPITTGPTWASLGTNGMRLWNSNSFLYKSVGSTDGSTVTTTLIP